MNIIFKIFFGCRQLYTCSRSSKAFAESAPLIRELLQYLHDVVPVAAGGWQAQHHRVFQLGS
jgi:hypothetical protein